MLTLVLLVHYFSVKNKISHNTGLTAAYNFVPAEEYAGAANN